jgi:hypothetical protein
MKSETSSAITNFTKDIRDLYSGALKSDDKPVNKVSIEGQAKNEVSILVMDQGINPKGRFSFFA